jgi:hypothetical protein
MDQSKILRQLRAAFLPGAFDQSRDSWNRRASGWNSHRPRNSSRSAATGYSADSGAALVFIRGVVKWSELAGDVHGGNLHLRSSHQKRNTVQPSRSRSCAVLAAQGDAGDAGAREIADKGIGRSKTRCAVELMSFTSAGVGWLVLARAWPTPSVLIVLSRCRSPGRCPGLELANAFGVNVGLNKFPLVEVLFGKAPFVSWDSVLR